MHIIEYIIIDNLNGFKYGFLSRWIEENGVFFEIGDDDDLIEIWVENESSSDGLVLKGSVDSGVE